MRFLLPGAALVAAMLLSGGCASTAHCTGTYPYQEASSVPALHGTDDLKVPSSPTAMAVPPPVKKSVPFAEKYKTAEGNTKIRCLDVPEPLPKPAPKGKG